jgi:drug/metabolite transporter (DMT)-like permease
MDRRSWTLLLILGAIWGASYLFIKIGLRDLSPGMIAWLRIALAAAVLMPLAYYQGALRDLGGKWGWLFLIAAVQAAGPFLLIALGEEEISSGMAGILVACAPLWTAMLAIWVDAEERSSGLRLVGVLVGFGGVAVLLGVDLGGSTAALVGGLMIVLASLGYSIGGFLVKKKLAGVPPIGMSATVLLCATAVALPVALADLPDETPALGPVAAVFVLGVLGTGIAWAIFYGLIAKVGPARTFLVTYVAPGFAIVYGAIFLSEEITATIIAGLALILGGSYLAAEGRWPWQRRPEPEPEIEPEPQPAA